MRRKGLKLNTEKTKIMRCKKGRRIGLDGSGKGDIEEVKEYKYLAYILQAQGKR